MVDAPWKVQQYCYFWLDSEAVTAEQITEFLGLEPDRTAAMGSRRTSPRLVPAAHRWEIRCETHGRIDEHASAVLARIAPAADRVRALVDGGDVDAGLMMVRWFDDPDGGYNAMGWRLSCEQIQLLARMGASVESDEYAGDFTAHSSR
ncbi:DUF4279 domain-containing protein [Micromonospora chalcea]|uniref:DUF4279 domain-containing protein n=1 Tax=Micromonospora chalcea TaxID=1874 RepID=UPI0033CE8425